jgi:hypothetical protein
MPKLSSSIHGSSSLGKQTHTNKHTQVQIRHRQVYAVMLILELMPETTRNDALNNVLHLMCASCSIILKPL